MTMTDPREPVLGATECFPLLPAIIVEPASIVLDLTVRGKPTSWARVQNRRGQFFTDPAVRRAMLDFQARVRSRLTEWPRLSEPLGAMMLFHFTDRHRRDLDNLTKFIGDALNGRLWRDDSAIVATYAEMVLGRPAAATRLVVWRVGAYQQQTLTGLAADV
jgi:Holliday junction resolvase RusA-like endonuclease